MKKRMIALALMLVLFGSAAQIYALSPACQPLGTDGGSIAKLFGVWNAAVKSAPGEKTTAEKPKTDTPTTVAPKGPAQQSPITCEDGRLTVHALSLDALLKQVEQQSQNNGYCPSTELFKKILGKIRACQPSDTAEPPATEAPATKPPATEPPATGIPSTTAPVTASPTTKAPTIQTPTTQTPTTKAPTTKAPATTTQPPATTPPTNLSYEEQVVVLVNKERTSRGLSPLTLSSALSDVARAKSEDMRKNNYFAHQSPTYGSPFDMMKKFGISYRTAGENIAMGYRTPEAVVEGWMNSEGHRANILNASFTTIGVGYVSNGNYWTQMFIG